MFNFFLLLSASVGIATAATTTVVRPATTTAASVRAAAPRVLTPATPPRAVDVQNSITNWQTSVNTVNDYLNNPTNKTKLAAAIVFSKDEPVQLATLMKVPAMSKAGVDAGKILMGNFGSIVSNLNSIQAGVMTTNDATAAVNFNRCCTVLPAIGALWTAASNATKIASMGTPNLEAQCGQMSCASGVSAVNGTSSLRVVTLGG